MCNAEKKTALYARAVNEATDNTNSVEIQLERLKKYAAENGYTNIAIYSDVGTNKTLKDSPQLSRMIDDVKNGNIGTVIVTDFSRFSRLNKMGMEFVYELFPKYGVEYVALNTNNQDADQINNVYKQIRDYKLHRH